jgi:hypothetical protein
MNPIEFTVKGITGTEIQTSGSTVLEFKLGKRMYRHRSVVPSVQMEYSGILGLDVLRSLQAKLDLSGNYMIVGHDRFPFVTARLRSHCSQGARKTPAVASNDRPGQSVRCERDSHIVTCIYKSRVRGLYNPTPVCSGHTGGEIATRRSCVGRPCTSYLGVLYNYTAAVNGSC